MMKLTLTPAQQTILHIVESLLISAILTLIMGIYQEIATHGLDWPLLLTFASGSLMGSLALIYKSISASPQFGPALMDTLKDLQGSNSQLIAALMPVLANMPAPGQQHPPVIVNLTQPAPDSHVNVSNAPVGTENIRTDSVPSSPAPLPPSVPNSVPQSIADRDTLSMPIAPMEIDMTRHYGDSGVLPAVQPAS